MQLLRGADMKKRPSLLYCLLLAAFFITSPFVVGAQEISAADAGKYVGQKVTVCGTVARATYATKAKGQPTFLDLGASHPYQSLTVLIWGSDRGQFNPAPETAYRDKQICVTGLVELYRGKPEIVVKSPGQIVARGEK
jgi:DNA/RNA endonuclease YhcR with UshA esterase domain